MIAVVNAPQFSHSYMIFLSPYTEADGTIPHNALREISNGYGINQANSVRMTASATTAIAISVSEKLLSDTISEVATFRFILIFLISCDQTGFGFNC